jgi:integrase
LCPDLSNAVAALRAAASAALNLPWSKVNKKSWRDDVYIIPMLKAYFDGKALLDISVQLVERFKTDRMNTPTKKGTARQPATVKRELNPLSSAFSLAVLYDKADFNPCSKVDLFPLDNLRYRYLLPEKEPRLVAELNGPRTHLRPAVIVALGTGMRLGEQLRMKHSQVNFLPTSSRRERLRMADRDIFP